MGKIKDAIQGVALSIEQKKRLLALDEEFSSLGAQIEALKAEYLRLQAEVNPIKRELEQLRQQAKRQDEQRLDETSEKILVIVANSEIPKDSVIRRLQLGQAKGDHHFDILRTKNYIALMYGTTEGAFYRATPEGRRYLAERNLL